MYTDNKDYFSVRKISTYNATERNYTLGRKAPAPPKSCTSSFRNEQTNISSNANKNSQTRRAETVSVTQRQNDFAYIFDKLIDKEKCYVKKLDKMFQHLKVVSVDNCKKLQIMDEILNSHKIMLEEIENVNNDVELTSVFLRHSRKLNLYTTFAANRTDFSYLVTDISDIIIDQFKSRLLEYNFTLSEIKSRFKGCNYLENSIEDLEIVVKSIYQNILYATTTLQTVPVTQTVN